MRRNTCRETDNEHSRKRFTEILHHYDNDPLYIKRIARSDTTLANRQKRFYPERRIPGERVQRDSSDFFARSRGSSGSLGILASRYTFSREKRAHKFPGLIPTVYALDVFVGSAA